MAARRFLIVFAVLVVLVIVGAFTWRLFGPQLMRVALTPSVTFAESPKSPAAYYDRADAWLARPGLPSLEALWTPEGYRPAPKPAIAVFYVHPTTYLKRDRWNAPVNVEGDARLRQSIFVRSQASVFNGIGEIWAPKYRQATFGTFLAIDDPDAVQAIALAYTDVEHAFDIFLKSILPGQKIILAGHSQGSLHLITLLAKKIAGTPVERRVVAAYLIGWPISIEADIPRLGLKPCGAPDETRCIISFQSFAEPAEPDYVFEQFFATVGLTGASRENTKMVCTNPLTGGAEPNAEGATVTQQGFVQSAGPPKLELDLSDPGDPFGPEHNLGSLIPLDQTYEDARLDPGKVGGRCMTPGYLSIGAEVPEGLGSYVMPGNNYHVYDYALYWTNLRADAERRAQAALAGSAK